MRCRDVQKAPIKTGRVELKADPLKPDDENQKDCLTEKKK